MIDVDPSIAAPLIIPPEARARLHRVATPPPRLVASARRTEMAALRAF